MKNIALSLASLAATTAAFFVLAGTAAAGGGDGKTTICHYTGSESNPVVIITVSDNAVPQHLAHGDDLYVDGHCGPEAPPL